MDLVRWRLRMARSREILAHDDIKDYYAAVHD